MADRVMTPSRIAATYLQRTAVVGIEEVVDDEVLPVPDVVVRPLFSAGARTALTHAFGVRASAFFDFYDVLRLASAGGPAPEDGFVAHFRFVSRLIFQKLTTEETKNKFTEVTSQLRPLLTQLDAGRRSRALFVRVAVLYADVLTDVAADRGVYLSPTTSGVAGWVMFRVMSDAKQKMEELRRSDPVTYETVQESKRVFQDFDRKLEQEVTGGGLVHGRKKILGRPVHVGTDPVSGDEYVFDTDGDMLTIPEYVDKRRKVLDSQVQQTRVFPSDLSELRSIPDDEVDFLTDGDVEYVSMTDDKAKSNSLTRIYPVRRMLDGKQVVVAGRYRGFLLDDLVNLSGRMVEGVAYNLDPKSNLPSQVETRNADGTPDVKTTREPYVTVSGKNLLYLRIPAGNTYTALRKAVSALSKIVPSLQYEEGSRKAIYTFEPKDFAAVREALGGLALSTAAVKLLKDFFSKMARHELALGRENLKFFETEKIGGFKPGRQLYHKQKEAMAWVESRGHSGVVALDTGVGKTFIAIASMQKMVRDGLLGEGQQFLYVCPDKLRGNLPKEIEAFIENPKALRDRVKIVTYTEFTKAANADPNFASKYAAVLFDEAQAMKNLDTEASRAAMNLPHPRKILLTASPMEKSPMEVFTLVAIANSLNLASKDGRAQARAFRKRFCEEVGGKIVGIKNDPVTIRDFRVWVKQNLYFADKRDVDEVVLPKLRIETVAVTMDPEVEAKYRDVVKGIEGVLRGMVSKYRDRSPAADDPAIESARVKFVKQFRLLFDLTNFPERFVPGAKNPKLDQLVEVIDERVGSGRRTLVFTDSPALALSAVQVLSNRFPVLLHAECQSSVIQLWQSGQVVAKYRKKAYKDGEKVWAAEDWATYVLSRVVSPNPDVLTCTLTSSYTKGQNLQAFDTVVHLDRDAWNNETMKQRTARAWRSGQDHPVDEIILDAVYASPFGKDDETLDQIAGHLQHLEADLFDRVIIESQSEALGKEWFGMKKMHSSFVALNRRVMELAMSPYARRLGIVGVQGNGTGV